MKLLQFDTFPKAWRLFWANALPSLTVLTVFFTLVSYSLFYAEPMDFKWMGVATLMVICLGAGLGIRKQDNRLHLDRIDLMVGLFFIYAICSLRWSPDPQGGAYFLLFFIPLWVIFTFFKNNTEKTIERAALYGITASAATVMLIHAVEVPFTFLIWPSLGFQSVDPSQSWAGFFNHNMLTEFLLAALPFIAANAWMQRKQPKLLLPIAALIVWIVWSLLFSLPSKIEFLVIPGALFIFLFMAGWKRNRVATIMVSSAFIALAAYVVSILWDSNISGMGNTFRTSVEPRLVINWNTLYIWLDKPLFGQGAGGFSASYPLFHEHFLEKWPVIAKRALTSKFELAGATHNEYLQFLAEFGLAGVALLALIALTFAKALRQGVERDVLYIASLVAVTFGLINAAIEFPYQLPTTGLITVIALGIITSRAKQNLASTTISLGRATPLVTKTVAVLIIALTVFSAYRYDRSQRELSITYALHDDQPEEAYKRHYAAYMLNPLDPEIRGFLYQSLHQWNLMMQTPPLTPAESDEIFRISLSAGPQELTVVRRVQYLLDTGRYRTSQAEIERWLDQLTKHSYLRADVWVADAYYNYLLGRKKQAMASLDKARALPHDVAQDNQMFNLWNMISSLKGGAAEPFLLE